MKLDLSSGCIVSVTQRELDRRIAAVRDILKDLSAGLLMVVCPIKGGYQSYLTGESGPGRPCEGAVLIGSAGAVVCVNGGALVARGEKGERNFAMAQGMEGGAFEGYISCAGFSADMIEDMLHGSRRIALANTRFLRADLKRYLEKNLPQVELVDGDLQMNMLRARKSEKEIEIIRENALQADKLIGGAGIYINPMKYERDVVKDLRYAAYRTGSGGVDDLISVPMELVSYRDGADKDTSGITYPGRCLQLGDAVNVRMYPAGNDGYYTGISRTFTLCEPSEVTRRLWETAVKAQDAAAAALRPGQTLADAYAAADQVLIEGGCRPDRGNNIHGMGTARSCFPDAFTGSQTPISPGMVLYVGPETDDGVHESLSCGDTFLITQDGCERLTKASRELTVLYRMKP